MRKKLVNPDMLCMGCMGELPYRGAVCPKCGFNVAAYQRPENSLPLYEIVNGKYLLGRVLGIGGFGITYIAWDFYQGKKVCVKEYFPRNVAIRNRGARTYSESISVSIDCSQERSMSVESYTKYVEKVRLAYMKGLDAYIQEAKNLSKYYLMPGIVSIRDFFYGNNTAYIVMEYIEGMNMRQYAFGKKNEKISPQEVFLLFKDVLKALDAVHKDSIIHRDISPDNIMLTRQWKAVLIDFGAARDYGHTKKAAIQLKQGYAPIEQYSVDGIQGPWTDVYAICASMYNLLTGIRLPSSKDRQKQDGLQRLQVLGVPVSKEQDDSIRKGMNIEPQERYQSIEELYQDLYQEPMNV